MTQPTPHSRPHAIILIVEDEPIQRMDLMDLVEEAGFDTLEASNADHAIEILVSRSDVRVVFTDIEMPGSMDGLILAAAIRDRWPPIELIVTTAGPPPAESDLPARAIFLPKPLNRRQAIEAIRTFACASQ